MLLLTILGSKLRYCRPMEAFDDLNVEQCLEGRIREADEKFCLGSPALLEAAIRK